MKINYILSDTTAMATSRALQEVTKKAESNPFDNYVVIVPETKSIAIEREILTLSQTKATANIFVYNFVRLLSRVGKISPEKVLNKQISVMLLRKVISENAKNFVCYKKTAKNVNFAEKIYETIAQFKSSNVSPEDLLAGMNGYSGSLKAKLTDIILIYSEYEKMLGGKLFDDTDKLGLLINFAKTSDFIKNSEFFVVGFDNITYEMQDVLKEIAKSAKEITFSSVYFAENRADKYIQNNELYKKFKHIADELKYPYVPTFAKSYYSGDFYTMKSELFMPKKTQKTSLGQVSVFEAKNKYHEIEFVASSVIQDVKKGLRYRDIAIVSANLAEDREIYENIFKSMGLPLFVTGDYDISSHPVLKFLGLAFEIFSANFSADKVLEFLNNFFVSPKGLFDFENFVNEMGIDYGLFLKDADLSKLSPEKANEIQEIFSLLKNYNNKIGQKVHNAKNVNEFIEIIKELLNDFDVQNKLVSLSHIQEENNYPEEAEISRVIYEKLNTFLMGLENFMGDMEVSETEFLQILFSGFSSLKINLTPLSVDSVILQANSDGLFDIKSLYISSADENSFPTKINDSGIILDRELEEAKLGSGKNIEPLVSEINKREMFRAYETLLLPKEKLAVSYSVKTLGGAVNVQSSVVSKLIALFGKEIVKKNFAKEKFISKTDEENRFAKNVNRFLNNEYLLSDLNEEYSLLCESFSEDFKNALINNEITKKIEDIKSPENLYFSNNKTSVSQLEKYFSCPYRFFASYGLRLKENKQAKMNSLDIGNFIHKVAELFTKRIRDYYDLSDEELTNEIAKITKETEQILDIKINKNQALLGFLRKEVQRLCKYILSEQKQSSFKNNPQKNEFSFSGENAVCIQLDNQRVIKIEGKIDRVDEYSDYIRIIDYKTGDINSDLTSVYYGKKIQLVSYLLASEKVGNKKIAGLFYFPIHSDFVKNDKNINEKYKMQGFLLDDIETIKYMDSSLSFENPSSSFVPIKIKTNKNLENTNTYELNKMGSKKYLTESEFAGLKDYNKELCRVALNEILSGYIEPSPVALKSEDGNYLCENCELAGFCKLSDAKLSGGRKCLDKVEIESFLKEKKDGSELDA